VISEPEDSCKKSAPLLAGELRLAKGRPTLHRIFLALVFSLTALLFAQQDNSPQFRSPVPEPDAQRRATTWKNAGEPEGLLRIDVVVTDREGRAAGGLNRADFSLLDNGQPQKIISFHAFPASTELHPFVSVILLIDLLNLPGEIAAFERAQVQEFLRENSGHLTQPVTIYSLEDKGLFGNPEPSLNGNALAEDVDSGSKPQVLLASSDALSSHNQVVVDPSFGKFAPLTALRSLATIAAIQDRKPGRKLILWVGPGLRADQAGSGRYPDRVYDQKTGLARPDDDLTDLQSTFEKIYGFSTLLRQAHISLDVFSVGEDGFGQTKVKDLERNAPGTDSPSDLLLIPNAWKLFLDGVPSVQQASMMGLYKKVLAVQSGGRVLPPENALAQQIASCIADLDTFYTLTFNPPLAAHADEYHSLKVQLSQPGLAARTVTGYYDEPFYNDSPNPTLRRVTVEQLEQVVQAAHGKNSLAQQLSTLELNERLSDARLVALTRELHGGEARDALEQITDQAAFLPPPRSEVPADPPPDEAAQRQILAQAADYLDHILPKLPNFFASRSAIRFGETAAYSGRTLVHPVPVHVEERSKATVLYRHGAEILDATRSKSSESQGRLLVTHGTFGPLLSMIRTEMNDPGRFRWSRWQQGADGRQAIFHLQVAASESHYQVGGCCLPDGNGTTGFGILPAYLAEVAIDPVTGAILRVQVQPDLQGFVPGNRSDMMVAYGPIEIHGRTFILPLRSVNIWRGRAVLPLQLWTENFRTWGAYETRINDFTFDHYHMAGGEARMLPGFTPIPQM
jgi:VWFA-related protein